MTTAYTATPEESLSVLERWARARGLVTSHPGGLWEIDGFDRVLHISQRATVGGKIEAYWEGPGSTAGPRSAVRSVISIETAIAWALAIESGITVDVGRCPACVARSGTRKLATIEWGVATAYGRSKPFIAHPRYTGDGWERGWGGRRRKGQSLWAQHYSRPCPGCQGRGRDTREAARLVLDAAPRMFSRATEPGAPKVGDCVLAKDDWPAPVPARVIDIDAEGRFWIEASPDNGGTWRHPAWSVIASNPEAREHLTILAEQLRDAGDPLGEALAYLLNRHLAGDDRGTGVGVRALRKEWERLTVPCERCEGEGEIKPKVRSVEGHPNITAFDDYHGPVGPTVGLDTDKAWPCPDCNGHGRVPSKPSSKVVTASTPEAQHWANRELGDQRREAQRRDFAQEHQFIPVGRTQRMLEEAAAHDAPVAVVAADEHHAAELRRRVAEMGATNITVVTRHAARNQPRALGMVHTLTRALQPRRSPGPRSEPPPPLTVWRCFLCRVLADFAADADR